MFKNNLFLIILIRPQLQQEGGKKMKDINEKGVARLKISDEEYKRKIITIHGDDRPDACLRYYTRQWCFKSSKMCKHHKTHKPLTKRQEDEVFALLVKNGLKKDKMAGRDETARYRPAPSSSSSTDDARAVNVSDL